MTLARCFRTGSWFLQGADLVLIHQRWKNGKGRAGLSHNGDGHGGADPVLALLYLEIIQQRYEHILQGRIARQPLIASISSKCYHPACSSETPQQEYRNVTTAFPGATLPRHMQNGTRHDHERPCEVHHVKSISEGS